MRFFVPPLDRLQPLGMRVGGGGGGGVWKERITFQIMTEHFFPLNVIFFRNTSKEYIIVLKNELDGKQETTMEPRFNEEPWE